MKPIILGRWFVLLTMALAAALEARGEESRTEINPAQQYYQAFMVAPDLSEADRAYLFDKEWRGQKLPDRLGELLSQHDNEFKLVGQAALATAPCDWGIDLSPGPATLLPHLARCKRIVQTARLRAMWHLQQGRPEKARDELIAAFALARNSSRDGTVIATLVQIAAESIVCNTVAENFHRFSPEILKQISDGFEGAPPRGTVQASIDIEKAYFLDWLVNKILEAQKQHAGDETAAMAATRELVVSIEGTEDGGKKSNEPSLWERVERAAGGTSAGVLKLLRDEIPFCQRLQTIMSLPAAEYEEEMRKFSATVQSSGNPFVELLKPLEKCRPKELAIQAQLAMLRAAVVYKQAGESGLKTVLDPISQAPFGFRHFFFEGVDRGFELRSAYNGRGFPEVLIFVEKEGAPFRVNGERAGQSAVDSSSK